MFESLSEKLSGILDKLTGRGALSEEDVNAAMREVQARAARGGRRARGGALVRRPHAQRERSARRS